MTVRTWDVKTGAETHKICGNTSSVNYVALSPGGKLVVYASSHRSVRLGDVTKRIEVRRLKHTDWGWAVAFSPDPGTVATGYGKHAISRETYCGTPALYRLWSATQFPARSGNLARY